MIKKTLFSILTICFLYSTCLLGQKMRGDFINFERYELPGNPFPEDYKTYSVSLFGGEKTLRELNLTPEALMKDYFTFRGLKRVQLEGDVQIIIRLGEYDLGVIETDVDETTVRDTSGGTKTIKHYYKDVDYEFLVDVRMVDTKQNMLEEKKELKGIAKITNSNNATYYRYGKDKKFKTKSALEAAWAKDKAEILENIPGNHLRWMLNKFRKDYLKKHDYTVTEDRIYLWRLHHKSENSEPFAEAFKTVRDAFANYKANESSENIRKQVQPAIDFWTEMKETYPADNKKTRKVNKILLHNLASIYYALDEIETAKPIAEECIEGKGGGYGGWTKQMMKRIVETEEQFLSTGLTSRHMVFNHNNEAFVLDESLMSQATRLPGSLDPEGRYFNGFLEQKNGELIPGIIEIQPNKPLRNQKSVRFIPPENFADGKVIQTEGNKRITPEDVASFSYGARKFKPVMTAFLGGQKGASPHFLEVLEEGKISIYKYFFPDVDDLSDLRKLKDLDDPGYETYRIQKGNGIAEDYESFVVVDYFEDAPPVWEKMKAGAYGNEFKDKKRGKLGRILHDEGIDIGDLYLIVQDYNKYFREREMPGEGADVRGFGNH